MYIRIRQLETDKSAIVENCRIINDFPAKNIFETGRMKEMVIICQASDSFAENLNRDELRATFLPAHALEFPR
jgi:hypothetical protein